MTRPQWLPVLDSQVVDDTNPRSIACQALVLSDDSALMPRIYRDFEFDPEAITVSTPLETLLKGGREHAIDASVTVAPQPIAARHE